MVTQYSLEVDYGLTHLISATGALMGVSVDHSGIFSLFSPYFSHIDKKEYLMYQNTTKSGLQEIETLVICYCEINDLSQLPCTCKAC